MKSSVDSASPVAVGLGVGVAAAAAAGGSPPTSSISASSELQQQRRQQQQQQPQVLHDLRADPSLSIFLRSDFDADKFATHIITQDSAVVDTPAAAATTTTTASANANANANHAIARVPLAGGNQGPSKAASAVSQIPSSSSVEQCVDALQRRLGAIDNSIKKLVGRNYDQLLDRAASAACLKESVRTLQQGVAQVETAASTVRQMVLEPLSKMQQRSKQLERIQTAGALLRALLRMNTLSKKLAQQMQAVAQKMAAQQAQQSAANARVGNSSAAGVLRDLLRVSMTLAEMQRMVDGDAAEVEGTTPGGSAGVVMHTQHSEGATAAASAMRAQFVKLNHVQQSHLPQLQRASKQVLELAHQGLMDGLRKFNQAQIGGALQVHFNLGMLASATARATDQILQNAQDLTLSVFSAAALAKAIGKSSADSSKPRKTGNEASGSAARSDQPDKSGSVDPAYPLLTESVKAVLWKRLTKVCDAVYAYSLQAWTLHRILAKKHDPVTNVSFLVAAAPNGDTEIVADASRSVSSRIQLGSNRYASESKQPAPSPGNRNARSNNRQSRWNPTSLFWARLTQTLRQSIDKLALNHPALGQFLTAEYPAVRQQLQSLLSRLQDSTEEVAARTSGLSRLPESQEQRALLLGCFDTYLQNYTAQATQSMRAQLKEMFAGRGSAHSTTVRGKHSALPEVVEISALTAAMRRQLRATRHDFGLCTVILGGVRRIGDQFARSMEHARATEPSALRVRLGVGEAGSISDVEALAGVGAKLTRAQVHNFAVVAKVDAFSSNLREILSGLNDAEGSSVKWAHSTEQDLTATAAKELGPCLDALDNVSHRILLPFFLAALKEMEAVMMGMHDENFGGSTASQSVYIGRVKLALATCQDVYLRPVPRSALATSYIRQFAQAIAVMFTRHASLLKPLSEPGSIRVASDAAELEMALNTLADSRGLQLDSSELQFLKQLLFVQSRQAIVDTVVPSLRLGVDVRPSTVLHHLFARASPRLQYPMQQASATTHSIPSVQRQQHSGRSYVENYCRWAFEQSVNNLGETLDLRRQSGRGPAANTNGMKLSQRRKHKDTQALGIAAAPADAAAVFDPFVNMLSPRSVGFEQLAFEKLQACCDQLAQRLTATEVEGGEADTKEQLEFVHAIVQAGGEMLVQFQRYAQSQSR